MRIKALLLLSVFIGEMIFPLVSYALTGGPSQPEVQSFEPVGTSEMVDVFSGDFNYNIPLLDVNGYPINIAYHAGVSMDQEASWVGLGWNINPGTINRDMRGLPDDMLGEDITKEANVQDNWTIGLKGIFSGELFGKDVKNAKRKTDKFTLDLGLNLGLKYNRYKGMGYSFGSSLTFGKMAEKMGLNAGLAMDYSDDGGLDVSPNVSLNHTENFDDGSSQTNSFSIGSGFNSRAGIKGVNLGHSASASGKYDKSKSDDSDGKDRKGTYTSTFPNSGITYSNALPSYTPNISTPMSFFSTDFSFKTGIELFGLAGTGTLQGTFSNQFIPDDKKSQTKKGYGYMYEQDASTSDNPANRDHLLDFNRQNDGQLMKTTPYLPWVNHTFDMYNVAAQGVGGSYRLHRNDLSVLHDDYRNTRTDGFRLGFDLAGTNALKGGVNLGYNYSKSTSGYWGRSKGNFMANKVGFVKNSSTPTYEPAYFKDVNELTPQNSEFLDLVESTHLVSPQLSGYFLAGTFATDNPSKPIKTLGSNRANNISKKRANRGKLLTYRKASESQFCLDKKITSYPINGQTFVNGRLMPEGDPEQRERVTSKRKGHHISEVEVLNTDGSRHIFGIPAYNNVQVEKSFRVSPDDADLSTGLVGYKPGIDNQLIEPTQNSKNPIDEYYSSTTTPAYAHSYLITGVLSPDYIDLTGNGISDDDLGSAVKFNYTKVNDEYGWRAPYLKDKAKYSRGHQSDDYDDMGNYVYGTKELWYTHSIEGKTHIALFKVSPREDGLGVIDENGGKDTDGVQYKLDEIKLYSKRELKEYGDDAVPIKTVHFVYNYDLCKGITNQVDSLKGKLTLEKIFFTYGASEKGRLNSYSFDYNTNSAVKYNMLAYDRWGTYTSVLTDLQGPTNAEFPYTAQDQSIADENSALWNLKKIQLPSGGEINVEYESDDYAYVQNKRANRMFKILGFGRWSDNGQYIVERSKLYEKSNGKDHNQTNIVFFELDGTLPTGTAGRQKLLDEYFNEVEEIQITANLDINNGEYEHVKTYVTPIKTILNGKSAIKCGVVTSSGVQKGWVQIQKERIRDPKKIGEVNNYVNPIAMAGWEYARMNLPYLVNPSSDRKRNETNIDLEIVGSFVGFFNELATIALGPNKMLMERKFCQNVNFNNSWIRLSEPRKAKLGGGS